MMLHTCGRYFSNLTSIDLFNIEVLLGANVFLLLYQLYLYQFINCICLTLSNVFVSLYQMYLSLFIKGTVHQMYECCSDVLLHLGRMFSIVFMVQRCQIWPKSEKTCF